MQAPYGSWPSPLGPELLAVSGVGLDQVAADGGEVYWLERRPTERGRQCIVRRDAGGTTTDVLPPGWNARTLVHEYGGGDYTVRDGTVYFSSFDDQRLYRVDQAGGPSAAAPVPITPEPALPRGDRYADMTVSADGARVYAVRERHRSGAEAVNELVVIPAGGGEPVVVAGGHDFYSTPRLSPDGTSLAWLAWDHPRMPWDGTELWEAAVGPDGTVAEPRLVAGGPAESVFQPAWGPDGSLWFVSDRSGWWNLYRRREPGGEVRPVAPMDAELGLPQWVFGMETYALLATEIIQ